MGTFSTLQAICVGNSPVTGKFPSQRPVTWSFDIFFDLRLNNDWVNNHESGDLRCTLAHYDITVMNVKISLKYSPPLLDHCAPGHDDTELADDSFTGAFLTHWLLGDLREIIFKLILVIDVWGLFCEIVFPWTPQDLTDDKSTLVQVMAWCRQATSHYLSKCWPSSLSPYGISRP